MDPRELQEMNKMLDGYQSQVEQANSQALQAINHPLASSVYSQQNDNLIVYQLELDNTLERIEHLLRGDIIKTDKTGNQYYVEGDSELRILNDFGAQLIMNTISFYINRNTILSNYDPERIDEILEVLGNELADAIYCNYEKMGMDTDQKKSRYNLLVMNILHLVESGYKRAMDAGERGSIRTGRIVTQNDSMNPMMMGQMIGTKKQFKLLNPRTWA